MNPILLIYPYPAFPFGKHRLVFLDIFIVVSVIHDVVLVTGVQQSEPVVRIPVSTRFQILFPFRSLRRIE